MRRVLSVLLFAMLAACVNRAVAGERHTVMKLTPEQEKQFIQAYKRAPLAYIDPAMKPRRDVVDLLQYLQYTPAERNQGACGNCWQWAGTGCMEISHAVQNGVQDRLSIQYFNSCETSVIGKACCAGGWAEDVAMFYSTTKIAIPWSNENAFWQDADASCDTDCASIATSPSHGISSITAETIPTQGVMGGMEAIMNVLDQNRPVFFAFYLSTTADWQAFINFWDTETENIAFDFGPYCDHVRDGGFAGHAVLCVGYDNDDPEDSNWIMLNSWGTTAGRPSGLFRVPMDMNYNCADTTSFYNLYFQALSVTFEGSAPTPTPTPPSALGSINVSSSPVTGAEIFLDYFDMGQVTNSVLAMVNPGLHAVRVNHPSFPPQAPQTGVQVNAGVVTAVAFQLKDITQIGNIAVESAPETGAAIYLDYRDTGQVTDATLFDIGPGTHFVSIRKDGMVSPGVQETLVESGLTTPALFELWISTDSCPITVSSVPTGADIYLDYLLTGQVTDDLISGVGYGIHDVTVRKGGYLIPPSQTVELSASTCSTSLAFQLMAIPTPTPTPTITPTPFPQGLRVLLNQATLRPGDVFQVSIGFTNTILDWDGYVVIVRSDGRAWSVVSGNRLVEGIHPIVGHALEIHQPFGPVEVLSMQIPYGVPGFYGIYAAILPLGTTPTIQNARGPYSQLAVEPVQVLY